MTTSQGILVFLYFSAPLLVTGGLWLWLRRRESRACGGARASLVSRAVETVQLLLITALVFVFLITCEEKGGLLLKLCDLRPQFTAVYLALAGIVLLTLILLTVAAFRGRTRGAVCLAFVVLYIYAFILDGPFDLMRALVRLIWMEVLP